jgi:hypothetical protein
LCRSSVQIDISRVRVVSLNRSCTHHKKKGSIEIDDRHLDKTLTIDLCRTSHTKLRVERASQGDRVITARCALKDIVVGCSVASFARSDGVLLGNRHDIVAEQNVVGGWIEAELLCGCGVSKLKAKDTIIICRAVSVLVLKFRRRCSHVDEETSGNG